MKMMISMMKMMMVVMMMTVYFGSKVKEAVDVAVRLQSNKLKEDSKAENQEFFNQPKSSSKSTQAEEPKFKAVDTKMQHDQGNESGHIDDLPDNEAAPKHDCFTKLEYHFEESYKAINDRLDWHNLEGHEYPFDLSKPLPLIKDRGCQVVPADYFINNDLEYLQVKVAYNKHAVWEMYHWGSKRQRFYAYACHWKSPHDVYSKRRIIAVTSVKVMRWYDYGYLEEIVVRRDDNVLYKFKEGDFPRLNLRDIEDMLLLLAHKKLSNLDVDD
nr:hypothetical protein [Tanacetum cinerariifolium]